MVSHHGLHCPIGFERGGGVAWGGGRILADIFPQLVTAVRVFCEFVFLSSSLQLPCAACGLYVMRE